MTDAPPALDLDWPAGTAIRRWYAGGSSDNPYREACVWVAIPNPGNPADDPHLTIRPARLCPERWAWFEDDQGMHDLGEREDRD